MQIKYCPNCGLKRTTTREICIRCKFNFTSVNVNDATNGNSKYNQSKGNTTNLFFSVCSYITNGLYILLSIWIYFIAKEMISRGDPEISILLSPIAVAILLYVFSAFLYYKNDGIAYWLSLFINLVMIIPGFILVNDFREFYNMIGDSYGDIDIFLFIAVVPIFYYITKSIISGIIIIFRLQKTKKISK